MKRSLLCISLLALILSLLKGQERPFIFESYYLEDGLPSEMIYCLTEDPNGLIWMGTANGLGRFDGSSFKKMYSPVDSIVKGESLNHHIIKSLLTDKEGNLWVGTQGGGVNFIDYKTEKISYYLHDASKDQSINHNEVLSLAQDSSGNIWIGTEDGLAIIEQRTGKIYNFFEDKKNESGIYGKAILKIEVNAKGEVYFTTWGGPVHQANFPLNEDLSGLAFTRLWHTTSETNTPVAVGESTWGLLADSNGRLWGGSFGLGLLFNSDHHNNKDWQYLGSNQASTISDFVFAIEEDHKGNIWVGTSYGLSLIDLSTISKEDPIKLAEVELQTFFSQAGNASHIPTNQIRDIFVASNDIVWIATEGGLAKYDPYVSQFRAFLNTQTPGLYNGINDLCKDDKGNIWATNFLGELICLNEKTGQKLTVDYAQGYLKEIPPNFIKKLSFIDNKIWIGTHKGLFVLDPVTQESKMIDLVSPQTPTPPRINNFTAGPNGNIWISSYQGIIKLNPKNWQYKFYHAASNQTEGLADNRVNDLLFIKNGNIWAAAEDSGMMEISFSSTGDMHSQTYFPVPEDLASLVNRNLRSIIYDGSSIWVGGVQGLFQFDIAKKTFTKYGMEAGLRSPFQASLNIDKEGNIWGGSRAGITCFDTGFRHFTHFGKSNGIPSTNHYEKGGLAHENGFFYYSGDNGFIRFDPQVLRTHFPPPQIIFEGLKIDNKPVRVNQIDKSSGKVIMSQKLALQKEIILSHEHNIISIDFSIVNFRFAKDGQVTYRLKNLENNWHDERFSRSATYTNLEPGTYYFEVQAANHEGKWNDNHPPLKITVLPPFWETWYFRLLTIIGFILVIFAAYKYRTAKIKSQNRILQKRVDERTKELAIANERESHARQFAEEANQAKSEFLANMSHEIRTPMNGVLGMAELLDEDGLRPDQQDYVKTIRSSGENLLGIINDILDFSKIESGKLELEMIPIDLQELVEEVMGLFGSKLNERPLELLYEIEDSVPQKILGDSLRLRQIMINLIGNALKFTEKGEIILRIENPSNRLLRKGDKGSIRFAVIDSGIGIPIEKQKHLFQAFSQVDASTTRKYGGTGLGLAISAKLVQLMGGQMNVKSTQGKGSIFFFEIATQILEDPKRNKENSHRSLLADKKVLIVEDNEALRLLLAKQLQSLGIRVSLASNGKFALEKIKQQGPFDVILTDLFMPEVDGLELAKAIREQDISSPIILISALSSAKTMRGTGLFAHVLAKPLKQDSLVRSLHETLGIKGLVPAGSNKTDLAFHEGVQENSQVKILLVEDNPVNRKLALRMMHKLGYDPKVAVNGLEGFEATVREQIDIVLMDVQMPVLDGINATRKIRAEIPLAQQPIIIAMTANAMQGDREKCIEAGMNDYISKPFRMAQLAEKLSMYSVKRTKIAD